MIPYDDEFLIITMPTTIKGTAKVMPGNGVKIHHVYYWSELFRDPEVQGLQVAVRFDPFDVGIAYAFVHRQWVQCHSEYYAVFRGRSEKELMLATQEIRRRCHQHSAAFAVTARQLAEFLQSVEAEETLLTQRLSDREGREIRRSLTNEADRIPCGAPVLYSEAAHEQRNPRMVDDFVVDGVYGAF